MKKLILLFLVFAQCISYAQVGISTETPNAAAELDIVAPNNNTGVLIPIFTDAQITSDLNPNEPTHGMLIYNSTKQRFMYNAGTNLAPLWSFVGAIPVIDNIANITGNEIEGDIRYCATNNLIYFWNGTVWKSLEP